jgi:hypothetical protein
MQRVIKLYCLGNDKRSQMQFFSSNIFNLWLVESIAVESTDTDGWLYMESMRCLVD